MRRDPVELGHLVEDGPHGPVHRWRYRLPEDLSFFEGHFRGLPVLPAAAQLDAVILPAALGSFPELGALRRASRLKFLRPVRPGDEVEVVLSRDGDGGRVTFEVRGAGDLVGSGVLLFEAKRDRASPSG